MHAKDCAQNLSLTTALYGKSYSKTHFTNEEEGSERLSNFPKVTQLPNGKREVT